MEVLPFVYGSQRSKFRIRIDAFPAMLFLWRQQTVKLDTD
jgi:hypothetical protein